MLISLKCVVTEVVLFSIVDFKTLYISKGSVATHLRCGGISSDSVITNFLPILVRSGYTNMHKLRKHKEIGAWRIGVARYTNQVLVSVEKRGYSVKLYGITINAVHW